MSDQYLFAPIIKGIFTYHDVFVARRYGIEDFDLAWQMIHYQTASDLWSEYLSKPEK